MIIHTTPPEAPRPPNTQAVLQSDNTIKAVCAPGSTGNVWWNMQDASWAGSCGEAGCALPSQLPSGVC